MPWKCDRFGANKEKGTFRMHDSKNGLYLDFHLLDFGEVTILVGAGRDISLASEATAGIVGVVNVFDKTASIKVARSYSHHDLVVLDNIMGTLGVTKPDRDGCIGGLWSTTAGGYGERARRDNVTMVKTGAGDALVHEQTTGPEVPQLSIPEIEDFVRVESKLYRKLLPQLVKEYLGRWVVFRDGVVQSAHDEFDGAFAAAVQKYGPRGGFVVAEVRRNVVPDESERYLEFIPAGVASVSNDQTRAAPLDREIDTDLSE